MSSYKLRRELLDDPLAVGYAGMTDAEVLTSITDTAGRPLADIESITSGDLYDAIDQSEYALLPDSAKDQIRLLLGLGSDVNVGPSSKARALLISLFPVATATRASLLALVTGRTQSRAAEIGINAASLTEQQITSGRLPDQP